jgi:hypothetical protein
MSLILGQLIYTSFPKGELKVLTSEGVSPDIRDAFIERVTEHWAAKGPSRPGYRCVYLHQIAREKTLFGWLYNDDIDDVGRSHRPYFIGYYLTGPLNPAKLKNIFALLEQGPPNDVDRQNPPEHLEPVVAPDLWNYQPARIGVAIPAQVYERSLRVLEKGQLIDFFVPHGEALASQTEVNPLNPLFQGQPLAPLAGGETSSLQHNSPGALPWKPLLGVAAVCVAAITMSLSFIFSPGSTSDFPEGRDTAYAIDGDAQIAALASDPRARLSPEPITGQSLEAAKRIVAQVEQPLSGPFLNQSTQKLAQSVEARARERLENTPASAGTNAPKLSKKLVAALEKETPPLSPREKARLKAKAKLKSTKLMAKRPSSQSTSSGAPSIVVIDSSREVPLKRTESSPAPSSSAKASAVTSSPDCYGAQAKRSYQCRNRKN